ncbi:MAG: App1 family protein [Nannocystaceae bacterium]
MRPLRPLAALLLALALACDGGSAPAPSKGAPDGARAGASDPASPASPEVTATPTLPPSNLKSDEHLRLFPALALPRGDGGYDVELRAWVFEPEDHSRIRAATVSALRKALELPEDAEEAAIFKERSRAFLVDNEGGKRITVTIAGRDHALETTAPNGQSVTRLRLAADDLAGATTPIVPKLRDGDARRFDGVIHRLDPGGLSVISDIDDTIKISEVRDKERLLARTFVLPFEAVPAMAETYRRWADAGATFHYVSASPWQLYDVLQAFAAEGGFPAGSFHLKSFRWKDTSFFSLFQDPVEYKLAIARPLVAAATGRRFILVGDSGERDPEVYAALLREHPGAVVHVYIRDVTGEGRDAPRYVEAFKGLPADRWTIFTDAATLPSAPPGP